MSQVERVNAAWERIEKWYTENIPDCELGAPATAADITAVETHIGLALSEEVKASLMRHNGVGSWPSAVLLSTQAMKANWDVWAGLVDKGTFDNITGEDNESIQKCWFNKSWIPLDADGCGNGTHLDLNPGPKGTVGQIIYMDNEQGARGPLFQDFAGYLEDVASKLEAGKYRVVNGYPEEIF